MKSNLCSVYFYISQTSLEMELPSSPDMIWICLLKHLHIWPFTEIMLSWVSCLGAYLPFQPSSVKCCVTRETEWDACVSFHYSLGSHQWPEEPWEESHKGRRPRLAPGGQSPSRTSLRAELGGCACILPYCAPWDPRDERSYINIKYLYWL